MVQSRSSGKEWPGRWQAFLHFFFFFLHLVAPSSDLHVSKSVKQSAWQSAKTTHGGSEGTGGEGDGGGGLGSGGAHSPPPTTRNQKWIKPFAVRAFSELVRDTQRVSK